MDWKYHINITQFLLSEEKSFEEIKTDVIAELKKLPHFCDLNYYGKGCQLVSELYCSRNEEEFQFVIDEIYDYADNQSICLGGE